MKDKLTNELYKKFYNDLYNPDLKIQFIEEKYPLVEGTKNTLINNFRKSAIIERQLDKDLFAFNTKEIHELVSILGYATTNTVQSALSYFSKYVDWSIEKGLRGENETGINDISIFMSTQNLSQYVSAIKAEHRYITKDEIEDIINGLVNYSDKAIVLSLYEGIGGEKLHELRSLRIDNIDFETNEVKLIDINGSIRTKKISNKLINILKKANEQDEYLLKNGWSERIKVRKLLESPYIIRPLQRESQGNIIEYNTLKTRIAKIKRYVNYELITAKSIQDSGAINRVLEIAKQYGLKEPTHDIFSILKNPREFNMSTMQLQNLKQKYYLVTGFKDFK